MERYFHEELEDLRNKLILLGEKSNDAARLAVSGLLESDLEKITVAINLDDAIDDLEKEIAHACLRYTTLRSPVSTDMRLIIVALKASHDFERVGDEAHRIAKKAHDIITREGRLIETLELARMGDLANNLIQDAITCFVEEDAGKANNVIINDKAIDQLNQRHFEALSNENMQGKISDITRFDLVLISKSIERIGDHAKNLAREVLFLLNGD